MGMYELFVSRVFFLAVWRDSTGAEEVDKVLTEPICPDFAIASV